MSGGATWADTARGMMPSDAAAGNQRQRGAAEASIWKEVASLIVGGIVTYCSMRAVLYLVDPQREEKDKAASLKQSLLDRLNLSEAETGPLDEHEAALCSDVLNPSDIRVGFDEIGGMEEVKRSIMELIVFPLQHPHLFVGKLLRPPKGILLYGPPGTGKTMMAKAIAKQSGARFINLSQSTLQNKWFGESVKLVRAVFKLAIKLQPTVIFIDEIDAFLRERSSNDHQAHSDMKCEFMTLWDGIGTDDNSAVIVLGASNRPWDIDEAIQRRLSRSFKVPLPSLNQRIQILSVILLPDPSAELSREDIAEVAERTQGYSGSDLHELCRAAAFGPVRAAVEGLMQSSEGSEAKQAEAEVVETPTELRKLRRADFEAVLEREGTTQQAARAYSADVRETKSKRERGYRPASHQPDVQWKPPAASAAVDAEEGTPGQGGEVPSAEGAGTGMESVLAALAQATQGGGAGGLPIAEALGALAAAAASGSGGGAGAATTTNNFNIILGGPGATAPVVEESAAPELSELPPE